MKIDSYNRNYAVAYASKWANKRNTTYYNFDTLGGDCTNFVSQCLYAGTGVMNYTKIMGWYYNTINDRTPSWSGVQYFYNFLVANKGIGPFASIARAEGMMLGDIVQLGNENEWYHTLIITEFLGPPSYNSILTSSHTFDTHHRHLNSYVANKIRYLHIEGVRRY